MSPMQRHALSPMPKQTLKRLAEHRKVQHAAMAGVMQTQEEKLNEQRERLHAALARKRQLATWASSTVEGSPYETPRRRPRVGSASNELIVLESQNDEVMDRTASTSAGGRIPRGSIATGEDAEDTVLIVDSDEGALAASPPDRRDT